jgi:thiol-disulfide isomerase/thioredoxin
MPLVAGVDLRMHNLAAEAHGRPLAVVFISHDCPVCNTYAPEFARIAATYADRVLFALVYAEPGITAKTARAHAKAYGLGRAELLLDPGGDLAKFSGATVTPEAAVFDAQGRRQYLGRIDDTFYDFGKQRPKALRHDLRLAIDTIIHHRAATAAAGPPFGCVIETGSK